MPELPEVETVRRSLEAALVGRRIEHVVVRERRLRVPIDERRLATLLAGRRIVGARRRAKYLLVDLEPDAILLVHLGMTGRLRVSPAGAPLARHDHVILGLDDGRELRFHDPRRFGMVDALVRAGEAGHPALVELGLEPLDDAFNAEALHAITSRLASPIKNVLMDARRVVGVGNIYASESLFRARIHPATPARKVSRPRVAALVRAVRQTLRDAIAQGGTTLRDFEDANGEAGYFGVRLRVYGREGEKCVRCGRRIRRIVQGGRSTFYCPGCQRR